jgi:hypothetical protein
MICVRSSKKIYQNNVLKSKDIAYAIDKLKFISFIINIYISYMVKRGGIYDIICLYTPIFIRIVYS